MLWRILFMCYLHHAVHSYYDYELYHNLTESDYQEGEKKTQINKLAAHGFGRILTWNVKKLGACLRQDNVDQLKEVVCVILQSANLVVLQEAENLDLSCLPCSTALKDEYEWPGDSANDEFRVFVKTRHSRSFSIKKYGVCDVGVDEPGKKSHFHHDENIYQAVMREYQIQAEKKQRTEERHMNFVRESTRHENLASFTEPKKHGDKNKAHGISHSNVLPKNEEKVHEVSSALNEKNSQSNDVLSNKDVSQNGALSEKSTQHSNAVTDKTKIHNDVSEKSTQHSDAVTVKSNPNDEVIEKETHNNAMSNKMQEGDHSESHHDGGTFMVQEVRKIKETDEDKKQSSKDDAKNVEERKQSLKEVRSEALKELQENSKKVTKEIMQASNAEDKFNASGDSNDSDRESRDNNPKEGGKSGHHDGEHKEEEEEEGYKFRGFKTNQRGSEFMKKVNWENNRFTKTANKHHKKTNNNNQFSPNENDGKDESEMSDRQMERFHGNEKEMEEEPKHKKQKEEETKKEGEKETTDTAKENLKNKLYKTREKLNEAKDKEKNADKYKAISNQLVQLEAEINELNKDDNEIKSNSTNERFSEKNNETGEAPKSTEKLVKNERFNEERVTMAAVNNTLSENKENSKNNLNRFHEDSEKTNSKQDTRSEENAKTNPSNIQKDNEEKKLETKENSDIKKGEAVEDNPQAKHLKEDTENKKEEKGLYSNIDSNDKLLSGIDIDSDRMHNLVNKVLKGARFIHADDERMDGQTLNKLINHHHDENSEKRTISKKKKRSKKKKHSKIKGFKRKHYNETKAVKRQMFSPNRDATLIRPKNLNYIILTVQSDLNSGEPFIIANVRFPKEAKYQRACMEKVIADISVVNTELDRKAGIFVMGDFHFDRLSGAEAKGELYKMNTNLQIDGENYHCAVSYLERDPITTVYGRRFDNICSNINMKSNMKTIGPDFPLEPESVILPITLQRLYNNYITALYTTDNDESDNIYECIKAFQMAGKKELDSPVCKNSWVPSSYISDHLPLQFVVKMNLPGKSAPLEIKLASWNIQGDTFKERLLDPVVRKGFLQALKKYHVAVFHEFPPHDRIIDDQELGSSDIVRLRQGQVTTEFGIYVSEFVKDGETDMYVLRKKFKGESIEPSEEEVLSEPTAEETRNLITTVGLFSPKIVVDTVKIRPCLYTVKTSKTMTSGVDFSRIINAIDKDVQERKCDFKVMLASLNLEENFDLDKEIYKSFKYINLKCLMNDGENKFKYNIPRSRDLADYAIILGHEADFEFGECTIGLPGDEVKRGIDKLSDFEELTTHYPLSIVIKQSYNGK